MLNNQVYVYMVDTSAFYTPEEKLLGDSLNELHRQRNDLKKELLKKNTTDDIKTDYRNQILDLGHQINDYKKELLSLLKRNVNKTRQLDTTHLKPSNVVGVFESNTTRVLQMPIGQLSMDIVILQVYFFSVLESIIKNGFEYIDKETGEVIKYRSYTASAGQIRKKKLVLIREDLYNKYEQTLFCGLTVDKINSKGGCNTNKFLAYTALNNSATDVWKEFDIRKAIVVDDMEFDVNGVVDFIDYQTFEITRQNMPVPIPHTDGCGMMLYKKFKKAHMVRLPFVKGLLVPFPFDEFVLEQREKTGNNNIGVVTDIYGKQWDILGDNIEVILTKSQFKMSKYYEDWKEYQDSFEKYNCDACICNQEEDYIKTSTVSYQMLQTLTDISDDELVDLCKNTKQEIANISSDIKTMLSVLGATKYNKRKNFYQKSLYLYPELLQDVYSKEVLKNKKRKLLRDAYAGKINVGGRYTFVSPDLYAFCEYLFLRINKPKGLLNNNEVSCNLFEDNKELDCLRSPHLYREHAIRINKNNEITKKWFVSKSIYVSTNDLISKLLQMDSDGDCLQIIENTKFVQIAKRNMQNNDIVPLYYEMKKADANILNPHSLYNGLETAYTGGNIGAISNDITKIWNNEEIDLTCIKYLCMVNNFTIDEAKTLFTLQLPKDISDNIKKFTMNKLPRFFEYAKDKKTHQLSERNNSTVNRLYNIIGKPKLSFKKSSLPTFDYKMLKHNKKTMYDENNILHTTIIDYYKAYSKNIKQREENHSNTTLYEYKLYRDELTQRFSDINIVCDVLIEYLYNIKNSRFKLTLWSIFGDIIYNNLCTNLKYEYIRLTKKKVVISSTWKLYTICEHCGKRIVRATNNQKYCKHCANILNKQK